MATAVPCCGSRFEDDFPEDASFEDASLLIVDTDLSVRALMPELCSLRFMVEVPCGRVCPDWRKPMLMEEARGAKAGMQIDGCRRDRRWRIGAGPPWAFAEDGRVMLARNVSSEPPGVGPVCVPAGRLINGDLAVSAQALECAFACA